MKKLLRNRRGEGTYISTAIITLFITFILALLLLYATVTIETNQLKNGVKQSLNNVSAQISADTYNAMRQGSIDTYVQTAASQQYRATLRAAFDKDLLERMDGKSNYVVLADSYQLSFTSDNDSITYTFTGRLVYTVSIYDQSHVVYDAPITITARHNLIQ